MKISTFLAAARNSSERLVAAIFNIRVDPLGVRFGTEQRPVRSSALSSCDRGRAVEGGRGLGSRSRFKAHALLELSCPLKVPIGHECQLCFVPAI